MTLKRGKETEHEPKDHERSTDDFACSLGGAQRAQFLLWSGPIVKDALSAQPYAALAWSGVSLLLPVGI
jgi:hypothetical protein